MEGDSLQLRIRTALRMAGDRGMTRGQLLSKLHQSDASRLVEAIDWLKAQGWVIERGPLLLVRRPIL